MSKAKNHGKQVIAQEKEQIRSLTPHVLGLMLSLPFLVPVHTLPIASFYSELLAIVLGLVALLSFIYFTKKGAALHLPMVLLIPSLLFCLVILQYVLGYLSYAANAMLFGAALIWCALMMLLGANIFVNQDKSCQVAAVYLLLSSALNGCIGLLQFMQWDGAFGSFIVPSQALENQGVFGNLAQQNHYASQLAIGLISAGYLWFKKSLKTQVFLIIAGVLLSALFLSRSRSAYLYVALIVAVGCYLLMRGRAVFEYQHNKNRIYIGIATTICLGLIGLIYAKELPQIQRLLSLSEALNSRVYLWGNAWNMFLKSPIWGVGFDQFAYVLFQQMAEYKQTQIWGLDQYAHNLFLQLLAVAGLLGVLSVGLPLFFFIKAQWRSSMTLEYTFFVLILLVLGMHSMLEQPLYYMYFLGLAALALGALDRKFIRVKITKISKFSTLAVTISALSISLSTWSHYSVLEQEFFNQSASGELTAAELVVKQKRFYELHQSWFFKPYMESINPAAVVAVDANAAEKIQLNLRLLRFAPLPETAFRHVALHIQNQDVAAAKQAFVQASFAFPADAPWYVERFQFMAQDDPQHYLELHEFVQHFIENRKSEK